MTNPLAQRWLAGRQELAARWRALSPRDRRAARVAAAVLGLALAWLVLVRPAWQTVRQAPPQIDALDAQLQQMQRLAAEAQELRATTPLSAEQSVAALEAATARLGDKGKLVVTAERATLTVNNLSTTQLRDWLSEARNGARARPVAAQLVRGPGGHSGSLVVVIGGAR
jgi:general secretion pathway protein M